MKAKIEGFSPKYGTREWITPKAMDIRAQEAFLSKLKSKTHTNRR